MEGDPAPGVAEPLAWGVVCPRAGQRDAGARFAGLAAPQPAVRLGDRAVVLAGLVERGLLPADGELRQALRAPDLTALIELGPSVWRELRGALAGMLAEGVLEAASVALSACDVLRPVRVVDYVDFYASREHAENFGRIFRPGRPPLAEGWFALPVGYHGRSSTVLVSGTPVRRPRGQVAFGEYGPTRALDLECELGFVCGPSVDGPVSVDRAPEFLFGVVLVNDWSARDIQRLESVPLGPHQGKSFATSMSAWITPLDAVAGARVAPGPQDPEPAVHLRAGSSEPWALDVALEIELNGEVLSRPNASWLYWTPAQMLAQMTANGARLSAGDLFATGTVSGSQPGTEGSLAEIARGERWLADGDEVVLRGVAAGVALGEVRGTIVAAG